MPSGHPSRSKADSKSSAPVVPKSRAKADSKSSAPVVHKGLRDPFKVRQLPERSTGSRAPVDNKVEPPYRAPVANMIEPPFRAPVANMIEPPFRAPVANMVETPYRAPTAHMYPNEQSDSRKNTYRGRDGPPTPNMPMHPGADGLTAGHHRPSERLRDGYSSRERPSSGAVGAGGGRREPSEGSHSYERSGDRYGDRYRDGSTEPPRTYRG
ncbi:hypothetical protein MMC27_003212 [Xylographa pallens]|nr:hypothetical protein [Xylographa pallens]